MGEPTHRTCFHSRYDRLQRRFLVRDGRMPPSSTNVRQRGTQSPFRANDPPPTAGEGRRRPRQAARGGRTSSRNPNDHPVLDYVPRWTGQGVVTLLNDGGFWRARPPALTVRPPPRPKPSAWKASGNGGGGSASAPALRPAGLRARPVRAGALATRHELPAETS